MQKIVIPQKEISKYESVDVLVVGGGPAGIGAAVNAARENVSVMLLEKRSFLGGNITSNYVETCNHFLRNSSFEEDGIYKELKDKYRLRFNNSDDIREDFSVHRFSSEYLKVFLDDFMKDEGVNVKLHAFVNDVIVKDDKISFVVIQSKKGPLLIKPRIVIDCTGDGDVAFAAGVPFDQGDSKDGLCQPGTLNFRLSGVDVNKVLSQPGGLDAMNKKFVKDQIDGKTGVDCTREGMAFGRLTMNGLLSYINFCDVYMLDPTDVDDLTKGEIKARKIVMQLIDYLKKTMPGMENIELASFATEMGFRDSRRIKGLYTLTTEDIEQNRSFPDAIAVFPRFYDMLALNGDWSQGRGYGTNAVYTPVEDGKTYQIPYRSLVPVKINNLLVAGRCISSDHVAESTIRAISACMLTGQAAGAGGAISIKTNVLPSQVDYAILKDSLLRQGTVLCP